MSTAAAKKLALKALQLFPPFRWSEQQEIDWIEDVMRETAHFSDEVLEAATTEMVRKRKRKDGTPAISDCIGYCVEAKRWLEAEKGKGELSTGPTPANETWRDWTEDAFKLSRDLMSGPMGLQAAKEGWIGCLDAYCRKHKRLPQEGEIPALKRKAREFDETYAECVRGGWDGAGKWAAMGGEMLAKRKRLQDWRLSLR